MPRCDVQLVGRIPVTTPSRTLLDIASGLGEEAIEIAFDHLCYRRQTSLRRMRWELQRQGGKGKPGTGMVRKVLDRRTPGEAVPESVLETKVLRLFRRGGLPLPLKQHSVRFDDGGYRLDFAYPDRKVIIEVDGRKWHSGRLARERDRLRDNVLTVKGWLVLRFTWEDVLVHPDRVLAQVEEILGSRGLL